MTKLRILKARKSGRLDLSKSGLTSVPADVWKLTHLKMLDLSRNQLTEVPTEIGQLTALESLALERNQLTELPAEIGQLTALEHLLLHDNQLTELPVEIGQLTALKSLFLGGNQLTELPVEIGQLTALERLALGENQLTELPVEIGQLTALESLALGENQLTELPVEIGQLTALKSLFLGGNQLSDELAEAHKDLPLDEFLAYLRGLEGERVREVKVLLVGEGEVGKSNLLRRFRGKRFVENLATTHGIEIKNVETGSDDPDEVDPVTFRFWDFGGQEVYRVTHQFFFSSEAIYVVVWKPREGTEANLVEDWIRRIRLRVGGDAKVFIVATHCAGGRRAEIDFPTLKAKYGDLLVGHYEVDNETEEGIADLFAEISQVARQMEHFGRRVPAAWVVARNLVIQREETHIDRQTYDALCESKGLSEEDRGALLRLLHLWGYVVYWDTRGLQDFIVLDPEWLTKAISYVLEDQATVDADGELDHHRLREIWRDHGDPERECFDEAHFPYFVRLMEKYEVSYRLREEHRSLVAQLVPWERPELDWERADAPVEGRQMQLVCRMARDPDGFIPWLTVRTERWRTGKYWRNGVLLRDADGHEALIERTQPGEVVVTVRGNYPPFFMGLLKDGIDELIHERWRQLDWESELLCPTADCDGRFALRKMQGAIAKGRDTFPCDDCYEDVDLAQLLSGYGRQTQMSELLDHQLEEIEQVVGVANAAQTRELTRNFLRAYLNEAKNGPRLFTLEPLPGGSVRKVLAGEKLLLTLWCEHPGHEHPCGRDGQAEIAPGADWLVMIGPYLRRAVRILQPALSVAGAAAGVADATIREMVTPSLSLAKTLADTICTEHKDQMLPEQASRFHDSADQAGLREFHRLLEQLDLEPRFGGLTSVVTNEADILWVCPRHLSEYEPGLPKMPEWPAREQG